MYSRQAIKQQSDNNDESLAKLAIEPPVPQCHANNPLFQCAKGYYQTSTGQSSCVICPANSYCPVRDQAPIPCATGEVSVCVEYLRVALALTKFTKHHILQFYY